MTPLSVIRTSGAADASVQIHYADPLDNGEVSETIHRVPAAEWALPEERAKIQWMAETCYRRANDRLKKGQAA